MSDKIGGFSWWRLLIAIAATALVAGGTIGSFLIAVRLMK
jgi:hypothetical protein